MDTITLKEQDIVKKVENYNLPEVGRSLDQTAEISKNEEIEQKDVIQTTSDKNSKGVEFKVLGLNDFAKKSKVCLLLCQPIKLRHTFIINILIIGTKSFATLAFTSL